MLPLFFFHARLLQDGIEPPRPTEPGLMEFAPLPPRVFHGLWVDGAVIMVVAMLRLFLPRRRQGARAGAGSDIRGATTAELPAPARRGVRPGGRTLTFASQVESAAQKGAQKRVTTDEMEEIVAPSSKAKRGKKKAKGAKTQGKKAPTAAREGSNLGLAASRHASIPNGSAESERKVGDLADAALREVMSGIVASLAAPEAPRQRRSTPVMSSKVLDYHVQIIILLPVL